MIYTVTTNPCIDYYMDLTAPLRVGEINRAAREECRPGGKGVNVAILLSRLGADACAPRLPAARAARLSGES